MLCEKPPLTYLLSVVYAIRHFWKNSYRVDIEVSTKKLKWVGENLRSCVTLYVCELFTGFCCILFLAFYVR